MAGKSSGKPGQSVKKVPSRNPGPVKGAPKTPILPDAETSDKRICWRFRHIDHEGPWSFANVDASTWQSILRKLADFESMTVTEAFCGNPGKDYEITEIPHPDVPGRLDAIGLADQTRMCRFELQGLWRLYGFRQGNIFHVVWWDPQHEIWPPSHKRPKRR